LPGASPEYEAGLEQVEKPPPSSWQPKLTPPSLLEKPKLALGVFEGSVGRLPIEGVGGGVRSIVHEKLVVGADALALTKNVCVPSPSELYVLGLLQSEKPPPSSLHRKSVPALFDLKLKLALVWFVGFRGEPVMVMIGLAVSINQL